MTEADQDAADAAAMLAEFGEAVVIAFPGSPSFDPVTGAPVSGSAGAQYTAKGYPGQYGANEVDDSLIKAGDIRLILERIAQRPEASCTALVDGVTYRVMAVRPVRKAGQDVIYICQLRRN
jgi:hypothetical protein